MKIFFDSNIYLRHLVPENPILYKQVETLLRLTEQGKITPYSSNIVITEVVYVLTRTYKFPKQKVIAWIKQLFGSRNFVLLEKTDTPKALQLYSKYNIKFGDCLIATQIPKGVTLCSYDKDFTLIPFLNTATPDKIILHG